MAPLPLDPPRKKVREKPNARRATNKGCLPMTLDEYLQLLDWTGRQIRKGKTAGIPPECAPILKRLNCGPQLWLNLVRNFRKRFRREAGLPETRRT
jgi:hypothetical protein